MASRQATFEDYEGFMEKFKPKKTTDDCYTPTEIYDCILDYVDKELMPLEGWNVMRPFYPGGDFAHEQYGDRDVVIDNPPFSILKKIIDFYASRQIKFFLFAPSLTLFTAPAPGVSYIVADAGITYENGAFVRTGFVTNMEGKHRIIVDGELAMRIKAVEAERKKGTAKEQRKIVYPDSVVTSALLQKIARRGISFKVPFDECSFVRKLDNYKGPLFGGGYLLSERAAAERAAAERAAAERAAAERAAAERAAAERAAAERAAAERAALSEKELFIIRQISKK